MHPVSALRQRVVMMALAAFTLLSRSNHTPANVIVSTTRAIVDIPPGDTTIRLSNTSNNAALVQMWADAGDPDSTPDSGDAPFEITPSLFVLESGKSQAVRIQYDGAPLPESREYLYWLNVLDIPSRKPKAISGATTDEPAADSSTADEPTADDTAIDSIDTDAATLNFVLRTRIKLFARPTGLPDSALQAPGSMNWRIRAPLAGAEATLVANNPAAFHVTCAQLFAIDADGNERNLGTRTFAPDEVVEIALTGDDTDTQKPLHKRHANPARQWTEVVCHAINDFGSIDLFRKPIGRSSPISDVAP